MYTFYETFFYSFYFVSGNETYFSSSKPGVLASVHKSLYIFITNVTAAVPLFNLGPEPQPVLSGYLEKSLKK
jgi:hypothetical protein